MDPSAIRSPSLSSRLRSTSAMLGFAALFTLLAAPAALAHPVGENHVEARGLGARWYHEPDHPAHRLFARQNSNTTSGGYPAVGSAAWTAKYPAGALTVANTPAAWLAALNASIAAGKIPTNCPVSTMGAGGVPAYKNSSGTMDPGSAQICSSSDQCPGDGQVYNAPAGVVGLSFDDGPLPPATALHTFLRSKNQKVTHFYIGQNILQNPTIFMDAYGVSGDDIAVHTWTHPYMTTFSNEQVLAELGWTMQIIHDSTGGRLPRFWRPPYGDSDNRVRAIAREIFGLTTVIWNQDTNDWAITEGTQTVAGATKVLQTSYAGNKSTGLIILEHELSTQSVGVFMDNWGLISQYGWTPKTIADTVGQTWYLNSADDSSAITTADVGQPVPTNVAAAAGVSSSGAGRLPAVTPHLLLPPRPRLLMRLVVS